jgi:hypothetical protein
MQLLIHLPDTLGKRFQQSVPVRKRSAFISHLLEKALPKESPLYLAALAAENDEFLNSDLALWDETSSDGLDGLQ